MSRHAIYHRIAKGRLHRVMRGVYAVGRPQLTRYGRWMAAVLRCGPGAVLSHESAAALWEIVAERRGKIEVSAPAHVARRGPGIVLHRRSTLAAGEVTRRHRIPVTTPVATLIDTAARLGRDQLETAINEADKLGLVSPEGLRSAVDSAIPRPGVAALRETRSPDLHPHR